MMKPKRESHIIDHLSAEIDKKDDSVYYHPHSQCPFGGGV